MDIRDLQTFLAVAASGSITQAAQLLGRSQPSVTRTIQDLEAELGFDLLHRVGRRVQLSEEGVAFEGEARRLLASFTELAARAKTLAAGKGRILQVAATAAIGIGLLPAALARLPAGALPSEIHVAQFPASVVSQEVRSGRAEIGFSSLPLDTPGLDVIRLFGAPNVAALRIDDPMARLECVPLASFAGRPMVTMLNPLRFQRHVDRALGETGVVTGPLIRTNVAATALQIVRHTGTAAIVDPVTAYGLALPDVVVRPIDCHLPFYWGAIAGAGRHLRDQTLWLVDAVEKAAFETIPGVERLEPAMARRLVAEAGGPMDQTAADESASITGKPS